ncbi:hypothetical protein, partial [Mesorhizobium sp.]|uniref:hypothetical protein n=1 Tax=Mesorhizobium sp. TaxID=1871066 RepID=UPI0025C2BA2D
RLRHTDGVLQSLIVHEHEVSPGLGFPEHPWIRNVPWRWSFCLAIKFVHGDELSASPTGDQERLARGPVLSRANTNPVVLDAD